MKQRQLRRRNEAGPIRVHNQQNQLAPPIKHRSKRNIKNSAKNVLNRSNHYEGFQPAPKKPTHSRTEPQYKNQTHRVPGERALRLNSGSHKRISARPGGYPGASGDRGKAKRQQDYYLQPINSSKKTTASSGKRPDYAIGGRGGTTRDVVNKSFDYGTYIRGLDSRIQGGRDAIRINRGTARPPDGLAPPRDPRAQGSSGRGPGSPSGPDYRVPNFKRQLFMDKQQKEMYSRAPQQSGHQIMQNMIKEARERKLMEIERQRMKLKDVEALRSAAERRVAGRHRRQKSNQMYQEADKRLRRGGGRLRGDRGGSHRKIYSQSFDLRYQSPLMMGDRIHEEDRVLNGNKRRGRFAKSLKRITSVRRTPRPLDRPIYASSRKNLKNQRSEISGAQRAEMGSEGDGKTMFYEETNLDIAVERQKTIPKVQATPPQEKHKAKYLKKKLLEKDFLEDNPAPSFVKISSSSKKKRSTSRSVIAVKKKPKMPPASKTEPNTTKNAKLIEKGTHLAVENPRTNVQSPSSEGQSYMTHLAPENQEESKDAQIASQTGLKEPNGIANQLDEKMNKIKGRKMKRAMKTAELLIEGSRPSNEDQKNTKKLKSKILARNQRGKSNRKINNPDKSKARKKDGKAIKSSMKGSKGGKEAASRTGTEVIGVNQEGQEITGYLAIFKRKKEQDIELREKHNSQKKMELHERLFQGMDRRKEREHIKKQRELEKIEREKAEAEKRRMKKARKKGSKSPKRPRVQKKKIEGPKKEEGKLPEKEGESKEKEEEKIEASDVVKREAKSAEKKGLKKKTEAKKVVERGLGANDLNNTLDKELELLKKNSDSPDKDRNRKDSKDLNRIVTPTVDDLQPADGLDLSEIQNRAKTVKSEIQESAIEKENVPKEEEKQQEENEEEEEELAKEVQPEKKEEIEKTEGVDEAEESIKEEIDQAPGNEGSDEMKHSSAKNDEKGEEKEEGGESEDIEDPFGDHKKDPQNNQSSMVLQKSEVEDPFGDPEPKLQQESDPFGFASPPKVEAKKERNENKGSKNLDVDLTFSQEMDKILEQGAKPKEDPDPTPRNSRELAIPEIKEEDEEEGLDEKFKKKEQPKKINIASGPKKKKRVISAMNRKPRNLRKPPNVGKPKKSRSSPKKPKGAKKSEGGEKKQEKDLGLGENDSKIQINPELGLVDKENSQGLNLSQKEELNLEGVDFGEF